jgi:hypothetical protein
MEFYEEPFPSAETFIDEDEELTSTRTLSSSRRLKREAKTVLVERLKMEEARRVVDALPRPGETWHVVSNGGFDFWTLVPVFLDLMDAQGCELIGSTWILNRPTVNDLLRHIDAGRLATVAIITGDYFRRRSPDVYGTIVEGLVSRGQLFRTTATHAKVILLGDMPAGTYLVLEGSANFCNNRNIEQYVVSNDATLYDFHKAWMLEIATGKPRKVKR